MKTLILKDLTKKYKIGKGNVFVALKPTNLTFDSTGLVSIVGKSGSGKSTLINLIGRIDNPSDGEIYFNNRPHSSFKKKDKAEFYTRDVGIVFQQYNLLENETVLTNVMLPLLISGHNKSDSEAIAKETLRSMDIPDELFNEESSKLSGGEKQRISIARAIVNHPAILLCDEPTGALDSTNSVIVMKILKRLSSERLVILVSHNLQLIKTYSDRIIEISDGKIIKDVLKRKPTIQKALPKKKRKRGSSWINRIVSNNYKRRIGRNIFSIVSLSISLTMMYLVFGFAYNKDSAIKNECLRQFDFGSGTVSEEVSAGGQGLLTLKKTNRPELSKLINNSKINNNYEICCNFSAILPQNLQITYSEEPLNDLLLCPVFSFDRQHCDSRLLIKGSLPTDDNLNKVIVNETTYKKIKTIIKDDPLGKELSFAYECSATYVSEIDDYVTDSFIFDQHMTIVGVVKEINYLPSPKIYYSYSAFEQYTKEYVLTNLSTYMNEKITWYDRVANADNHSPISAYSYQLFLKDFSNSVISFEKDIFTNGLIFTSQSLIIADSLFNFLKVAEYGLILFLVITFIGSVLILSIMSFTNFSEDHKISATLSSLGASDDQIKEIYLQESLLNGISSFILSSVLSFIYHTNNRWNEFIFEQCCQLSTTDLISSNTTRPWDLKKSFYLSFSSSRDEFLINQRFSKEKSNIDFEILDKKYYPKLYSDIESYNCNRLLAVSRSNKDDMPSFIGNFCKQTSSGVYEITYGSDLGYAIYDQSLMMGFSKPTYIAKKEEYVLDMADNMSYIKYEDSLNVSIPSEIVEGHFSKSNLQGFIFDPHYKVIKGREPANFQEILISVSLMSKLKYDNPINQFLYLSFPVKENILSNGYISREYHTVGLKIVGITDNSKLAISHKEPWSILFFQTMFGVSTFDLRIKNIAIRIDEGREASIISKLNKAFPNLLVNAPLQDVKQSVDVICDYIEIIMLIVSISSVIIASLILLICNHLHSLEARKDIGLIRCLGVKEKESRKFIYFHSIIMTGLSFIFSSIELLVVSFVLSKSLADTLLIDSMFVFNPLSLLYMFLVALFISLVSSLFSSQKISKISPLDCLS